MKSASQMKSLRDEIFFEDDILAPLGLNFLFEKIWLAQVDSNHRPRAYQARALTTWAMSQYIVPSAVKNEEWIVKSYCWNLISLIKFLPFFFSLLSYLLSSFVVEMMGFEPMTPCLQGRCSPSWATPPYGYLRCEFSHLISKILQNWTKRLQRLRSSFLAYI